MKRRVTSIETDDRHSWLRIKLIDFYLIQTIRVEEWNYLKLGRITKVKAIDRNDRDNGQYLFRSAKFSIDTGSIRNTRILHICFAYETLA
jgi:hypothetical protein